MIKGYFIIIGVILYIFLLGMVIKNGCSSIQDKNDHTNVANSMCLPYQLKHWYMEGETVKAVCLSQNGNEVLK